MRRRQRDRPAPVAIPGPAFMQNVRRDLYELGTHVLFGLTVAAAFDELAREV